MTTTIKTGRADYSSKRATRIDRLTASVASKAHAAESTLASAREEASHRPLGEPIHVGHHSEKRDRAFLARLDGMFSKGFRLLKEAKDADTRARSVLASTAISSDDPDAIEALKLKIAEAETELAILSLARDILAKMPVDEHATALTEIGMEPALARRVMEKSPNNDRCAIPAYVFADRRNNLKRIRDRVASLELQAVRVTREPMTIGDITITDNREDNRIQLDPGGPRARFSHRVFAFLKANGFKATRAGLMQRMPGTSFDRLWRLAEDAARMEQIAAAVEKHADEIRELE